MSHTNHKPINYQPYIVLVILWFQSCHSEFDQIYTGVSFTPYVKLPVTGAITPPWKSYKDGEIRVMLKVINQKFSKIVTQGAGSKNSQYKWNITYYNDANVAAHISAIAASINQQYGHRRITVLQGIRQQLSHINAEMSLAIECAEKANQIFPGTVEGLLLSHENITNNPLPANRALMLLHKLKNSTNSTLKLGTTMDCYKMYNFHGSFRVPRDQFQILKKIVETSDFVICDTDPPTHLLAQGSAAAFDSIADSLLKMRKWLQNLNSKIEVMGQIKWASEGNFPWQNTVNLRIYWETASQWAKINKFPIWLFEAFDNPWRWNHGQYDKEMGHYGFWKLTDNSKSFQIKGYIEKAPEVDVSSIPLSTGSVVAITLLVLATFAIVFLLFRIKILRQQLSKQDILEFMEGTLVDFAPASLYQSYGDTYAHQFPYDQSFEINKDMLQIDKSNMLGAGQYGYVYQATIKSHYDDVKQVALKVAKPDCCRTDLKAMLSEIKIMMYIGAHPNIVKLEGTYTAELHKGVVFVATELCSMGSLEGHLRRQNKTARVGQNNDDGPLESSSPTYENTSDTISFHQMVRWSQEIACGMEYLGTKNVVHADLATRNVLLTLAKTAKITDFGMSRRVYNYSNYIKSGQEPLPWRWMVIESLMWSEFSLKSDVWSYGVTLWEIFTMGDFPFPNVRWTKQFINALKDGLRLEIPTFATSEIYNVMVECWHQNRNGRPSFSEIQQTCEDIIANRQLKEF